ncbi:MAG: hypothetical protein UY32_C0029G0008 [Candidatus Jorgensenbacteria bacterium GW2011_GWC1_48_8]|nr:MAG: hypothetical protein UY32_C0029G0008 [Candidatus Jorgensenbacteria bacterium GW2011_GWC1_48_8]
MANKRSITVLVVFMLLSLSALLPVQAIVPPSSGQQLWWRFTEGSGSTVADTSGNGYAGTFTNGPTWATGKVSGDYAAQFTGGTHEFVTTVLAPVGLSIVGNQVSVCAFLQTTHHPSDHEVIVEMGENEAGSYGLFFESDGAILWQTSAGGVHGATVGLWDGAWHIICGVYDGTLGSNQMTLWEDAVLDVNTGTATGSLGGNAHYFTAGGFHTSVAYQLGGSGGVANVAEVMVYNRALSAGEVHAIYDYGVQVVTTMTAVTTTTATSLSTTTVFSTSTSPTTTTVTSGSTSVSTSVSTSTRTSTVTSVSTTTSVRSTTTTSTATSPQPFTIQTNSSLISYSVSGNGLNITVSGPAGTVGHTKVALLKSFFNTSPIVYLDNGHANLIPPTTITNNSTHWTLDLYYHQSQHQISIVGNVFSIPEYPSEFITLLLGLTLIISLAVLKHKTVKSL